MMRAFLWCGLLLWVGGSSASVGGGRQDEAGGAARRQLELAFAEAGIRADLGAGVLALDARVEVRDELLEYLLVRANGATHESLLRTDTDPELFNAALLALGLAPGSNVVMAPTVPKPTPEQQQAGVPFFDVTLPAGDGVLLYLAWREGEETYFLRVEDLLANLATGRTMMRHRWVFLGSRFISFEDGQEVFAATQYGNLVNLAFFTEGHTLVTAALPECVDQTIWAANYWLVPDEEAPVKLIVARDALSAVPDWLAEDLPDVRAWRLRREAERRGDIGPVPGAER